MADTLDSWANLNSTIIRADEGLCQELLAQELAGKRRLQFLLRIHSRLNKVRADRERVELRRAHTDRTVTQQELLRRGP